MLKFIFTDVNDKEVVVSSPLTLTINMEENVPADDMVAVFPYFNCDELKDVRLESGGITVFTGIVDEPEIEDSSADAILNRNQKKFCKRPSAKNIRLLAPAG